MKKRLLLLCLSVPVLFVFLALPSYAYILGDADNDFAVTAADARFALRVTVGLETCVKDSDQFKACDVNCDGKLEPADARSILRCTVGLDFFPANTDVYGGYYITKMPFYANGIYVEFSSLKDNALTLKLTNNTGKTIKDTSHIPYRAYNASGIVIADGDVFSEKLNNGDYCLTTLYIKDNVQKILFGSSTVYQTDEVVVKTTEFEGLTVTQPGTQNGLTILSYQKKDGKFYVNIRNDTGKAISSGYFDVNVYGTGNAVLKSITVGTERLNASEFSTDSFTLPEGTGKILFGNARYYEGTDFVPANTNLTTKNGHQVPQFPFTVNGIKFDFAGMEEPGYSSYTRIKIKATNNTGKHIALSTTYKAYGSDGAVLGVANLTLGDLLPGESSVDTILIDKAFAKLYLAAPKFSDSEYEYTLPASQTKNGVTLNTDFTSQGLTFSQFTVSDRSSYKDISCKVTNNTGSAINYFRFYYKVYGTDGSINESYSKSKGFKLNKGETAVLNITSVFAGEKILICSVYDVETDKDPVPAVGSLSFSESNGVKIAKAVTNQNGYALKSAGIVKSGNKNQYIDLVVKVTNQTGKYSDGCSVYYKVYNAANEVISCSYAYTSSMGAGETAEKTGSLPEDAAKLIIYQMN